MQKYKTINQTINLKQFEDQESIFLSGYHLSDTLFAYNNQYLYQFKFKFTQDQFQDMLELDRIQKIQIYDSENKQLINIHDVQQIIHLEYFALDLLVLKDQRIYLNKLQAINDKSIDTVNIYQLGFQFMNKKILRVKKHPANQQFITVLYQNNYFEIFDITSNIEDPIFQFDFNFNSNFKDQLLDFSYLQQEENIISNFDQLYIYFCSSKGLYAFGPIHLPNFCYDKQSLQKQTQIINHLSQDGHMNNLSQLDLFIQHFKDQGETNYQSYNEKLKYNNLQELKQQNYKITRLQHFFQVILGPLGAKIYIKIQEGLIQDSVRFILQIDFSNSIQSDLQNLIQDLCEFDLPPKQNNFIVRSLNDNLFILNGEFLYRIDIKFIYNIINKNINKKSQQDWQQILKKNILEINIQKVDHEVKDIYIRSFDQISVLYQNKKSQDAILSLLTIQQKYNKLIKNKNYQKLKNLQDQEIHIPEIDKIEIQNLEQQNYQDLQQKLEQQIETIDDQDQESKIESFQQIYNEFLDFQESFEEQQSQLKQLTSDTLRKQIELKFCKQQLQDKQQKIDQQIEEFKESYENFSEEQKNIKKRYMILLEKFQQQKYFLQTPDYQQQVIYDNNTQKIKKKNIEQNYNMLKDLLNQVTQKYEKQEQQNISEMQDQYEKLKIQIENMIKN